MLLIIEIFLVIRGLIALIQGTMKLTKKITLEGPAARIAGGIALLLPLFGFSVSFMAGLLAGLGLVSSYFIGPALIIEIVLVISAPILALIVGKAVQRNQALPRANASYNITENPPAA